MQCALLLFLLDVFERGDSDYHVKFIQGSMPLAEALGVYLYERNITNVTDSDLI
jgi:hypothetical protein